MSARLLYRIACVLLVLFAVGHTAGFLSFRPPTAGGAAVLDAMNNVHFELKGARFSYGGFYTGFGLFVTAYLAFAAFLAWRLGESASTYPGAIKPIGWTLCAVQVVSLVLGLMFFSAAPALFSAAIAVCVAWGTYRLG